MKKGLFLLLLFLASCIPVSYASLLPTPTTFQTPNIPDWGSTPSNPKYANNMPDTLNCALVPKTAPMEGGVPWRGLQVGVSTYEDVKNVLGADGNIYLWHKITGNLSFSPKDNYTWMAQTCFAESGKLAAMHVYSVDLYKPLSDIMTEYGNPDRVTWAKFYNYRSLLWAEKGLLVVVSEDTWKVNALSIILFSPTPRCQLEQSWVYQSLPKKGQIDRGDVAQTILNVEDPWKIEKGLSDCSKN